MNRAHDDRLRLHDFQVLIHCETSIVYRVKVSLVRPKAESMHCKRNMFPVPESVPAQRPAEREPITLTHP
jgi:hypothetical protein